MNPPITIDAALLAATGACAPNIAGTWAPYIAETCLRYNITTGRRVAAFLAQVGHESASFTRTVENLNYSAGGLLETWPNRFDIGTAKSAERSPQTIANIVYAGRMGNTETGDGWKYRGRGLIQVTGKANYEAIRDAMDARMGVLVPDFLALPDALIEPRWAALSAGAYWDEHELNLLADACDFDSITRRINGGLIGSADRNARYAKAKAVLLA